MRTTIPPAANQPLGTVGDPPTAASTLTVTDAPGTPTIKKNGEKRKFLLRLLVCTAIFSWLFFGWPQSVSAAITRVQSKIVFEDPVAVTTPTPRISVTLDSAITEGNLIYTAVAIDKS